MALTKWAFCYLDEKFPLLAIMFHILNLQESKVTSITQLHIGITHHTSDVYWTEGEPLNCAWETNGVMLKPLNQKVHPHNIRKFSFFLAKKTFNISVIKTNRLTLF
jgi:hypothetical protein